MNNSQSINQLNKNKQLKEIKKTFDWTQYVYLNTNNLDKQYINNDRIAWSHFKMYGFDLGLEWNYQNCNNINSTNKVLVVMPTYNRSDKIQGVIEMIIYQTFSNWIFLIIDDGSTPDNKIKFNDIKTKYNQNNKIIFLENEINCHIAKTLNRGINYLLNNQFTHFTWISDDNEYYPNFLEKLVVCNSYFKYSSFHSKSIYNKLTINKSHYSNYINVINTWGGCASFMWTKEAIQQIGYYNENVKCCEDYEYIIRTFKINSNECCFIDIPLMKYILHKECLTENNKSIINTLVCNINKHHLNSNTPIIDTPIIDTPIIQPIELSSNTKNIINYNIKIVTTIYLQHSSLQLQNCLKQLGLSSCIIYNINENYDDDNFYIILFSKQRKTPKKFIYWQIEQTSNIETPKPKFTNIDIFKMNCSLAIFEISSNNIPYYTNKITSSTKILQNQLPFSDIYLFNPNNTIDNYMYDITFFGSKCSRRTNILNKLEKMLEKKYRVKFLFGITGTERDYILKQTKYLLNIHYYENATIECDRFNIAINCNCLILSENCCDDIQNKDNYKYFVTYFDIINCDSNFGPNIEQLINVIDYNLKDEVFLRRKQNYAYEKQQLEQKSVDCLYKNLMSLNYFTNFM